MTKSRLFLLVLLIAGILIVTAMVYVAYRPVDLFSKVVFSVNFIFLVVVPFALWRVRGERFLKVAVFCTWAAYLVLWCVGIYRMYQG